MAYKNSHIFLPLVQKARKEKSLDKLLAGRGKWFVVQRDMFGDFPERPTAVDDIYIFGIFEIYKQGDTAIAQETEDAIVAICDQPYDDDAFLAGDAFYFYLCNLRSESAPFRMNIKRIEEAIKACIIRDKEKLLNTHKWVYTYSNTNGPFDLFHFMQMQNDIFLTLGVNLFGDSVFERIDTPEIVHILKKCKKDEKLIVELRDGSVVTGAIDEIYDDYDYIGTKEHPTYKVIERCDFVVSEVLRQGKDEVSCCDILDLSRPAFAKRIMDETGHIIWKISLVRLLFLELIIKLGRFLTKHHR